MPTATEPKDPVGRDQRGDGRGNGAGSDRPPWHVEGARPKSDAEVRRLLDEAAGIPRSASPDGQSPKVRSD